ncbi:MAG TPA: hypothetical protein VGB82_19060 [Alphaproteobacteria bacterium]
MVFPVGRVITAGLCLLVLALACGSASAQTAGSKRPGSPPGTATPAPWQSKRPEFNASAATQNPAEPWEKPLPSPATLPIEVRTRTSIPAQEEAASPTAPRSSLDYERAAATTPPVAAPNLSPPPPWAAAPAAATKPPETTALAAASVIAAAPAAATPSSAAAPGFVGAVSPMPCHATRYQVILDERAAFAFAQLCEQPDGSYRFAP